MQGITIVPHPFHRSLVSPGELPNSLRVAWLDRSLNHVVAWTTVVRSNFHHCGPAHFIIRQVCNENPSRRAWNTSICNSLRGKAAASSVDPKRPRHMIGLNTTRLQPSINPSIHQRPFIQALRLALGSTATDHQYSGPRRSMIGPGSGYRCWITSWASRIAIASASGPSSRCPSGNSRN
jgi:hypothetical protein